ncbi:MAG: gliding motility-associated C-terminal domain-containing protein [Ferruginibacter sp.]
MLKRQVFRNTTVRHFLFLLLFISSSGLLAAPVNDDPCNATTLVANNNCNYQVFTTVGATASAGVPAPGCANYNGGDIWFQVVVPCTGVLSFDTNFGVLSDAGMALYTGTCSNLTLLACDDNSSANGNMPLIIQSGLASGTIIWVRVWGFGNGTQGNFGICVSIPPPPPPGSSCIAAQPFCTGTSYDFPNLTNNPAGLGGGGIYTCLGSTPDPVFYYMQIDNPGNLSIFMSQEDAAGNGLDIDFCCWGPFPDLASMCGGLTAANNISCSFSPDPTETCQINNAQTGEYYLLLITNFSQDPGFIHFAQSGGSASTTCDIVCNVTASNTGPICPGQSVNLSSTITAPAPPGAIYTWSGPNCFGSNSQNTTAIPPSVPGNYDYTITITNGSGTTCTATTTVVVGGALSGGSATPASTNCPGANDGGITVTPPATGGPFTYTLNPGNVVQINNPVFTNLASGVYSILISNGTCSQTISNINVLAGAAPAATAVATNTSCPTANNGIITITPPAAGGPFVYTLNPGNIVQNNNPVFTGLAPNTYTITFTTAASCNGSIAPNPVIAAGAAPTATAVAVNTSCPGANNGTITVTPPATGGPFIYTLNPGNIVQNNNPVFTGLSPDTYIITFTTALGCNGTVPVNPVVSNGPAPTATAVATNTLCPGVSNGTITITPLATGAPFVYTLNPGNIVQNNNPVYTGLSTGTYTITFTTSQGCSGTVSTNPVISNGPAPTATAVAVNTTCPGADNGTITITPPATGAPFVYTLNPGNIVQNNNPVFTGLAPNTYTITFTTTPGCSGTVPVNPVVNDGPVPTATAVVVNTSCPGADNGTITITPPATGAPFIYTLNPGNIVQNNNPVFTGLAPNTYTITFTTALGCSGAVAVNPVVNDGPAPTATAVITNTLCPGVSDGTITITPPATGGPFAYTLNPGNVVQNNNPVFTGLATGTYTITFTTSQGCSGSVSPNPIINNGAAPTATAVTTNTLCPGVSDGTITITAPATGGPFVYTLNPGNVVQNNNPVFTGLATGTYTITFTTSQGCSGTVSPNPVINNNPAPTAMAAGTMTACPAINNGTVVVTPPASGGPFVYTLNPGNIVQNNNPVFTGLSPNTYAVTFTTATGCSGSVLLNPVVLQGAALAEDAPTITNPPCAFINDGILTIVPSTAGNYTYVLNPGTPGQVTQVNNPTFTGLAPGNYTYSFTNAAGCAYNGNATLTTHAPLSFSVSNTLPLCFGGTNGKIILSASGGLAGYQYALSPFTNYQGGTFNGLSAGNYTFRVKDAAGCTKDTTITLGQPTQLIASAITVAGTCAGNDGQINVTGSNGTPGYTYSIDGINYQTSPNFIVSGGQAPGIPFATISVKDTNGCIATAPVVNVGLIDNMAPLSAGADVTICIGQHTQFQAQADPQATIFTWTTSPDPTLINTLDDSHIKNPTATPLDTTTYVLNAQWGLCSRTDSITVSILHKPIPYAGKDTIVCPDRAIALLHGSATNTSGPVSFEWSDTTNVLTPHGADTYVTPPATEIFYLTVTDNYGCNFSTSTPVTVVVQRPIVAFAGNDTIAVIGQPHQLFATGGVSYEWSPANDLNLSNVQAPLATLDHDQLFHVTVTDIAGCVGSDDVYVQVYPGPAYHIPNAFSPNGDGLNDIFRVIPAGIARTDWFRIFNRFGELVFDTNQWLKGWDGTFKGKKQPVGNYVWILKGVDKNNRIVEMKGTVMLVQ